jgi:hypothetical protein
MAAAQLLPVHRALNRAVAAIRAAASYMVRCYDSLDSTDERLADRKVPTSCL